jgi:hypothetical protein
MKNRNNKKINLTLSTKETYLPVGKKLLMSFKTGKKQIRNDSATFYSDAIVGEITLKKLD